jgi:hypothetical protein
VKAVGPSFVVAFGDVAQDVFVILHAIATALAVPML